MLKLLGIVWFTPGILVRNWKTRWGIDPSHSWQEVACENLRYEHVHQTKFYFIQEKWQRKEEGDHLQRAQTIISFLFSGPDIFMSKTGTIHGYLPNLLSRDTVCGLCVEVMKHFLPFFHGHVWLVRLFNHTTHKMNTLRCKEWSSFCSSPPYISLKRRESIEHWILGRYSVVRKSL